jgi:hypothetical protein
MYNVKDVLTFWVWFVDFTIEIGINTYNTTLIINKNILRLEDTRLTDITSYLIFPIKPLKVGHVCMH